ncbi:MAG: glycosyltransferase family 2 protein [Granulosicoccus sp.]|nr:glycosyltransferase family 2 protein [Granulosicoccus sp.]
MPTTCIGMLFRIEACRSATQQADAVAVIVAQQHFQIGTRDTTRRILFLSGACDEITIYSHYALSCQNIVQIRFTRIAAHFARQRLNRTINRCQPGSKPHISTSSLYRVYSHCCPAPQIGEQYDQWRSQQTGLQHAQFDQSQLRASDRSRITVITVDHEVDQGQGQIQIVKTPFVLLLEKQVKLTKNFLKLLAAAEQDTEAMLLWFSDHEHVEDSGLARHPNFKPGWNLGLLHHGNYIGAMIVCRTSLFTRIGGLDHCAGQSKIYDFLLRASPHLDADNVRRISNMCYQMPASNYRPPHGFCIRDNDHQVLEQYLIKTRCMTGHTTTSHTDKQTAEQSVDQQCHVIQGPYPGTLSIQRKLKHPAPVVDIIIPNRDQVNLLQQCLDSLFTITKYPDFNVIIVDNDSRDPATLNYYQFLTDHPRVKLLAFPGAFNYSAINNHAAAESNAEVLLLLNNDTEIINEEWLVRMVAEACLPDVACVGAKLLYGNGLIQHAGIVMGMHGIAGHVNQFTIPHHAAYAGGTALSADFSAVTGACLAIRRAVYNALGGLDAVNLAVAYNDVDLCLRAREAGYRNRWLADAQLIHHESLSRGSDNSQKNKARFNREKQYIKERHKSVIEDDPAWNPNFLRGFTRPVLPGLQCFDQAA